MVGWFDGWLDCRLDVNGWTLIRLLNGWLVGWMVIGLLNGWLDGWMDRWMDGWMDRWMDGWMVDWTDGLIRWMVYWMV